MEQFKDVKVGEHPEDYCQECGNVNPSWHAPNDLWNKVTGNPPLIICPFCFQKRAESFGVVVHFVAESLTEESQRATLKDHVGNIQMVQAGLF